MATFDKADPKALTKGLADAGQLGARMELDVAARGKAVAQLLAHIARRDLQRAAERKAPKTRLAALKQRLRSAESAIAPAEERVEQAQHRSKAGAPLFGGAPPIVGRVVNAKGAGVRGAPVTLAGDDGKAVAQAKSDASGYFRLTAPSGSAGALRLWIGGSAERPAWETRIGPEQRSLRSTFHIAMVEDRA